MNKKRVVVTGLGGLTPIGNDVETAWKNAVAGVSGVGPLTRLDADEFPAKDADLTITEEIAPNVGVWIGSGIGGMETFENQYSTLLEKGARRVSPFFIPMMIPDMATGQVSIALGAKGVNSCTVTACATGTNSIGDAFKVIQRGDAD